MFHQVLQCAVTAVLSTFAAHTHKWVNHNVNHNVNSTILEWFLYIIEVAYSTDIIIEVAYSTDMSRRMVCVLGLSHRLAIKVCLQGDPPIFGIDSRQVYLQPIN